MICKRDVQELGVTNVAMKNKKWELNHRLSSSGL